MAELRKEDLWVMADKLRNNMDSAEYKHVCLGLIFLKYISDSFERAYQQISQDEYADPEDRDEYLAKNVFWVPQEARWETIKNSAKDPTIGQVIDNAMYVIEKENSSLRGVLPKDFARASLDKRSLGELVDLLSELEIGNDKNKDTLGSVYEYFLGKFARAEGKLGGEFYTPRSVVELIVAMIEPHDGRVYDPCCGSGGMFVQSERFVEDREGRIDGQLAIYGQESNYNTWKLCKMNLAIRGIEANLGQQNADSFHNDQHKSLKADYIMANPPFNLKGWYDDNLKNDPRWTDYGTPPESNANYAWILHMLSHLKPSDGVAGFLLANGALNDSDTLEIRKKLIQKDKVEAIIVLPRELFITTDISVTLWILNQNKKGGNYHGRRLRNRENEILFMDLRQWRENTVKGENKKKILLSPDQIEKASNIYHTWQGEGIDGKNYKEPELYRSVNIEEIETKGWALTPSKYIEFIDHDLDIDYEKEMTRIQSEMKNILKAEKESQKMLEDAFKGIGYEIY